MTIKLQFYNNFHIFGQYPSKNKKKTLQKKNVNWNLTKTFVTFEIKTVQVTFTQCKLYFYVQIFPNLMDVKELNYYPV